MTVLSTGSAAASIASAAHHKSCGRPRSPQQQQQQQSRRNLLAISLSGSFLAAAAAAVPDYPPKSPLIEQLLEKSRTNKTKNDQRRLDSYYERNYKDYFEFVEGTLQNKTELTETEKGILKWLERSRNKKK